MKKTRSKWYTCTIEPNMKTKSGCEFEILLIGKNVYATRTTPVYGDDLTDKRYHAQRYMDIHNLMAYLSGYNHYDDLTCTRKHAKLRIVHE